MSTGTDQFHLRKLRKVKKTCGRLVQMCGFFGDKWVADERKRGEKKKCMSKIKVA
jgi:hypothetical protein